MWPGGRTMPRSGLQHRWNGPQLLPVNQQPQYFSAPKHGGPHITAVTATQGHVFVNVELIELYSIMLITTSMQSKNRILEHDTCVLSPWPCPYNDEYPISTVNLLSHAWVALKQPVGLWEEGKEKHFLVA